MPARSGTPHPSRRKSQPSRSRERSRQAWRPRTQAWLLAAAVHTAAHNGVQELEQAAQKSSKEVTAAVKKSFSSCQERLKSKFQELEDLNAAFQNQLQALWAEYEEIYNSQEALKQDALAAVEKQKTQLKRKATALQKDCSERLKEAGGKIQKLQATKMPDVSQFLQALIA
jgi:hypothetical protein